MQRTPHLIALIAALQGASGVALAAAAAHIENSASLSTASLFLMVHAGAGLGLAAMTAWTMRNVRMTHIRPYRPRWLAVAAFALQAGVTVFSLDLVSRVFGSGRLFPLAAPIGGSLTILSWLALAAWAAAGLAAPAESGDGRGDGGAPPQNH